MSQAQRAALDPTSTALVGVLLVGVILGSLAVRTITSEYTTGMIRATFSAIPRRPQVLLAKALILSVMAFPVTLVSSVFAFLIGQRILASKDAQVSIDDPGVVRALVFGAVAVSVIAVMGVGLGTLIKRTAAATTVLSVALIGSELFGVALPPHTRQYLPGFSVEAVLTVHRTSGLLRPLTALAMLTMYTVFAFVAASILVVRRDT